MFPNILAAELPRRTTLLRWSVWFALANTLLFYLVSFFYLWASLPLAPYQLTAVNKFTIFLFIGLSFLGHLAIFALISSCLLIIPFILLIPKRGFIFALSISTASCAVAFFIIDAFVYTRYHFHLSGIITTMIFSGEAKQIFDLSRLEILWLITGSISILGLEIALAYLIWHQLILKHRWPIEKVLLAALLSCLVLSYYLLTWAASLKFSGLTQQSLILPLYNNVLVTVLPPLRQNFNRLETMGFPNMVQRDQPNRLLHYPLHPLITHPLAKPLNIILIVIDTWRFDMVDPEVTPNIYKFAQQSWQFQHHYSGGNATQPGIFSLFYSLSPNYWTATIQQQQPPVLITELLKQHYQPAIYASAELTLPAFNKNVFLPIENLQTQTPGATPYIRDQSITQQFQQFLARPKTQPIFTFLFYDSAHSYCVDGNPIQRFEPAISTCDRLIINRFSDPIPYLNRYKNALYLVDRLVGQDLALLKKQHLLENSVVILTGDHGNEFNDNHLGYWEHTSNYTRYQVQTPLIIHWPGRHPAVYTQQTSHYDLVPTLLTKVLGVQNPAQDYSLGSPLPYPTRVPFLLAGSYLDYGIIEPDRITRIFPMGNFAIYNQNWRIIPGAKLHLETMTQAFADMQKYYQSAS